MFCVFRLIGSVEARIFFGKSVFFNSSLSGTLRFRKDSSVRLNLTCALADMGVLSAISRIAFYTIATSIVYEVWPSGGQCLCYVTAETAGCFAHHIMKVDSGG